MKGVQMNVDYQVLTFKNQIKPKDIGGLGVELDQRKGSGNYAKERTQFNIEYVGLDNHPTLSSKVYETIYSNNIHFNKGDNTNILNGCIITSGPEFFRKLGLPMKDTGRVHVEGNHIGEPIFCPDIKTKEDIPEKVLEYFDESYRFMSNIVGKENVVYAGVHFDEDTPHMHFYFLPIVDQVKRKVFETDENGKRITKQIYTKDNTIKNVPVQKKDANGKSIYEIEYGKFLNSDEFWKQLGGKASFAKLQDQYNEYITSKGFKLDRGQIGTNKHHQDKAEHNIKVLNNEIDKLKQELELNKRINEVELNTNKDIKNINEEELLNPSKDIFKKYKDKDVEKLIDYSKEIKKANIASKNELEKKEIKIEKLENQIKQFKSGKTYQDKDKVIANQERIIDEQKGIIDSLNKEIKSLKDKIERLTNIIWTKLNDAYLAVAHLLGFKNVNKDNVNHDLMDYKVRDINRKHEPRYNKSTKDKSDDYEL
jgi:hypothetical protein